MKYAVVHLALILAFVASAELTVRGDTVVPVPNGAPPCIGQTIVEVKLIPTADARRALVMGYLDGRVVVADVDQKDDATRDKLFYVDLISDSKAAFSGLEQDIILIDAPNKFGLQGDMLKSGSAFNHKRGQVLELSNSKTEAVTVAGITQYLPKTSTVFAVTYEDYLAIFEFGWSTDRGFAQRILRFQKTQRLDDVPVICGLDLIDLNSYVWNQIPSARTLVVWGKRKDQTGFDGLQFRAPSQVQTYDLVNSDDQYLINNLTSTLRLTFKPRSAPLNTTDDPKYENVVGGYVLAPNPNGELAYYYASCEGREDITRSFASLDAEAVHIISTMRINLKYDTRKGVLFSGQDQVNRYLFSFYQEWLVNFTVQSAKELNGKQFLSNNYNHPGIETYYEKSNDAGQRAIAYLRPAFCHRDPYRGGKIKLGRFESMATEQQINQANRQYVAKTPFVPALLTRAQNAMRRQGSEVVYFMFAWPYFAVSEQNNVPMSALTTTSGALVKQENQVSYDYNTQTSIGFTVKAEASFFSGSGVTLKGRYGWSESSGTSEAYSVNTQSEFGRNNEEDYEEGIALFTRTLPAISDVLRLDPVSPKSSSHNDFVIPGLNEGLKITIASGGLATSGFSEPLRHYAFSVKDPMLSFKSRSYVDQVSGFSTDKSPFSAGIQGRPFSSRIVAKDDAELEIELIKIKNWQLKSGILDTLSWFASQKDSGISKYIRDVSSTGKVTKNDSFRGLFQTAGEFSFEKSQSFASSSGSVIGGGFETSLNVGQVVQLQTKFEFNADKDTKETFTNDKTNNVKITKPGQNNYGSRYESNLAVYYIDVRKLKSFMAQNSYSFFGAVNPEAPVKSGAEKSYRGTVIRPNFISEYCWDQDSNYLFFFPWVDI